MMTTKHHRSHTTMKHHLSFPIRSWVDLHHVCETSRCMAFHFPDCQNCFCLLLTLSNLLSLVFLIPGTSHPKRWSLPSPCCPTSVFFPSNSNPVKLALAGKAQVCLHQNALSSLLSTTFNSQGLRV